MLAVPRYQEQPVPFEEDEMEERNASLRHRIPAEKRKECLKLFEEGYGYKKTAQLAGLNTYTVRGYKRRYASGDNSWAERGSSAAVTL